MMLPVRLRRVLINLGCLLMLAMAIAAPAGRAQAPPTQGPRPIVWHDLLRYMRPAHFFKMDYGHDNATCRSYARSIAESSRGWVGATRGYSALNRSKAEVPLIELPTEDYKAVRAGTDFFGTLSFAHVDFDNTGKPSLVVLRESPLFGRDVLLPTASLRDKPRSPTDPDVLAALRAANIRQPTPDPGYSFWKADKDLVQSMSKAAQQPLDADAFQWDFHRYLFVRIQGRILLSDVLWHDIGRVHLFLYELKDLNQGQLRCAFSNRYKILR